MSSDRLVFREALRGYHKEDVNRYIEELNTKLSKLQAENKRLSVNPQTVQPDMPETEAKNDILRAELETLQKKSSELQALLDEKNTKLQQITAERDSLREQMELQRQTEQEKTIQPYEKPPCTEKEKQYDDFSRQIGSALIDARAMSETILSDAKAKSKQIIENAETDAKKLRLSADEQYKNAQIYINQSIKQLSSACLSEYISYINVSRDSFEHMLKEITDNCTRTMDKVRNLASQSEKETLAGIQKLSADPE